MTWRSCWPSGASRSIRHHLPLGAAVTPLLINAALPCRHAPGDRWFADETYLKVAGQWRYVYRAIDQVGQVIDVLVSQKRDMAATRRFFTRAREHRPSPTEVITDKAAVYPPVLEKIAPGAWHHTEPYANNRIESDHGRLKSRLHPRHDQRRVGLVDPGDVVIPPRQQPVLAPTARGRGDPMNVAAGVRLGDREGHCHGAVGEAGQPPLALLGRPGASDDRGRDGRGDHDEQQRALARK